MAGNERSFATVLSDVVGDVQQLIRAEVRLAKVEVREEVRKAARGSLFVAAGGFVALLAVAFVELAAVYALTLVWPAWAAALAVAAVNAAIGAMLVVTGARRLRTIHLPPPKTVATIEENIQWAKARTR